MLPCYRSKLSQLVKKRNRRHTRRHAAVTAPPAAEFLETRQLLSAVNALSDEFDDPATINDWQRIHQTEGWNADQLETWDIGTTRADQMSMIPHSVSWYQDYRGPFVYKDLSGDFVITTQIEITDRDDISGSDADDIPSDGSYSLAGLMIRTPRGISSPADWNPGSRQDDGTNNGENYVFFSMGYGAGADQFSFEVKTTRNSNSQLELTAIGTETNTGLVQIAKIGDTVVTLYQLPGQAWQVHRRFDRPDMPDNLQAGMVTYSDFAKVSSVSEFQHNQTVLTPSTDPTPGVPFNNDLNAGFDYTRFAEPVLPAELSDVNLLTTATDEQLLSFLGEHANTPFVPETQDVAATLTVREIDATPGITVGEVFEIDVSFLDTTHSQALFSGYADINFDPAAIEVLSIVYDDDYANGRTGTIDNVTGLVNELGAAAGDTPPADGRIATLEVRALQASASNITTDAGEDLLSEVLTYTSDADLRDSVVYSQAAVSIGSVDLEATAFDALSDHILMGQTDVTLTVANNGTAAAGAFQTHVVWSSNNIAGDADDVVIPGSTLNFASLASSAAESRTVSLQLDRAALLAHAMNADPAGQNVGTISSDVSHLFVVVDANNSVVESNEANNSGNEQGIDGDDVTYFPWDKNGNGTVTPLEALTTLQTTNTADQMSDFDGNGVVTPMEALSIIQRIGYLRNGAAVAPAVGAPASVQEFSGGAPAMTTEAIPDSVVLTPVTENAWNLVQDDDVNLFPTAAPSEQVLASAMAAEDADLDSTFSAATDWLSVI